MSKHYFFIMPFLYLLASCVQHTVIESGQQKVGSFIVSPSNQWNKVPSQFSISGLTTWTVDGGSLNSLLFIPDVEDGDTLLPNTNDKKFDTYSKDMLPNEIIELVESTLLLALDAKITNKAALRPVKIGADQGFEFELEYVAQDEVPRRAYIAAVIKDENLNVIFFQATKLHYYDSLIRDVKTIVSTAVIKS